MADDVEITIGVQLEKLVGGVEQAKSAVESLAGNLNTLRDLFVAKEVGEFIESMAQLGLQTERLSQTLGVDTEAIGVMSGMAKLAGSDVQTMAMGIERMSLNIQKAARDSVNPMAQALHILGLNARELQNVPADEWLRKVAEASARLNPSLNLTNALMEIGGRGFAQQVATLRLLGLSWNEWLAKVRDTGTVLDEVTTRKLAETHQNLTLLGMAIQGAALQIFGAFEPALDAIIKTITSVIEDFTKATKESGLLQFAFVLLSDAAKGVATGFTLIVGALRGMASAVNTEFLIMKEALKNAFGGDGDMTGTLMTGVKNIEEIARQTEEAIARIWTARLNLNKPTGLGNAGGIDFGASKRAKEAMDEANAQIRLNQLVFDDTKVKLEAGAKLLQMTEGQKTTALIDAIHDREQDDLGELTHAQSLMARNSAEWQKMEREKALISAKALKDIDQANLQSTEQMVAGWTNAARSMASAFSSQINGLLSGTETFAEAMKKTFARLIEEMIAKVIELIAVYATLEIISVATGIPAPSFAAVGKSIGIPGFAEGTSFVPRTGLALLHEGEAVIPKAMNTLSGGGEGGAGGGGNMTFNVSAIDAASFATALRNNSSALAKAIRQIQRSNPTLVGQIAGRT